MTEDLQHFRTTIDRIDAQLLDLLRERIRVGEAVGRYKKAHGLAVIQPQRIATVKGRAEAYAREHGFSETMASQIFDLIITETCRLEERIIDA